eukprot:2889192-Rhodomonas_salina.3
MSGAVFKEKCAITGEPARYRDPVTGLPYANLAAFKILRERHQNGELEVPAKPPSEPASKPYTQPHKVAGDRGSEGAQADGVEDDAEVVSAERLGALGTFPPSV